MELKRYMLALQKWWWLVVASLFVASISSYVGTLNMPRIYQATTTIMVGQNLQKANPSSQDLYISQQLAHTYVEMVKRRPILAGAAEALELHYVPTANNVLPYQVPGTQLLEINVQDTDPERARALADEIANQLILQGPTASESDEEQERRAFIQTQMTALESSIKDTQLEIAAEQAQLESASSARVIQQHQTNISALETKLSSYQSTYASLLATAQGGTNYITVVEYANTPDYPISPNVKQTVLLAAVIGLVLAGGGILLIDLLDSSIKTVEEAAKLSQLPVLGTIGTFDEEKSSSSKLITTFAPLSPTSESYRILRTNIQFSSVDEPFCTLMITSPGPAEGKSMTIGNLGVVLAQSGLKVIIVDTDLRRPTQHRIFGTTNERGLCDLILQPALQVAACLQTTEIDNLLLLPSGPNPPNPSELLASQRMQKIIDYLQNNADIVLFDSPPALVVTDAAVLGARMDGVLIVLDLGKTDRNTVAQIEERLQHARSNLLGLVINHISTKDSYYYSYPA